MAHARVAQTRGSPRGPRRTSTRTQMSHLRAPAARADRREGGRHGRPVARTVHPQPEARLRPQLLRLAVLPPIAVALSGVAAVLFTVRSTGARPGVVLWAVLAACRVRGPRGHPDRRRRRRPGRHVRAGTHRHPAPWQRSYRGRPARRRRGPAPGREPSHAQAAPTAQAGRRRVRAARRRPLPRARRRRHRRRAGGPTLQPGGQRTEGRGLRQSRAAASVPRAPRDLDPRRAGERDRGPGPAQGPLPRRPPRHPHPPATPRTSPCSAAPSHAASGATPSP